MLNQFFESITKPHKPPIEVENQLPDYNNVEAKQPPKQPN